MSNLQRALSRAQPPGIYRYTSTASPDFMTREAVHAGWRLFYLNGKQIQNKNSLLESCARVFGFPPYFGKNWDAFEECINDLSWAPASGYVVLFQSPERLMEASPRDWETALDIFRTAVENWKKSDVPFYLLMRGSARIGFPRL